MKGVKITVLLAVALSFCNIVHLQAAPGDGGYGKTTQSRKGKETRKFVEKNVSEQKSIWDDASEANPYFKQINKTDKNKKNAPLGVLNRFIPVPHHISKYTFILLRTLTPHSYHLLPQQNLEK